MASSYHYDIRYLLLPLVVFIPSFSSTDVEGNDSGFLVKEMKLLFLCLVSAVFLLASLRIQLFWCPCRSGFPRRIELMFGRPAISIPLTLSLITALLLPLSTFWNAYLLILVISFWSDSIHSFFFRFSHIEERLLFLPRVQPLPETALQPQRPGLSIEQGAIDESSSTNELV